MKTVSIALLALIFCLPLIVGCSSSAPPDNSSNDPAPQVTPTGDNPQVVDYDAKISAALETEDEAARVQALGEVAVAAAKDKNEEAAVNALQEIEKIDLAGKGRPEDLTPLETWTRDAAMALARSTKDPNVGIRVVQKFASTDPLKFKQISDQVMLEWTKVPGDVRDTITKGIPGIN